MPVRFGPIGLNPTLTISNFGIDSNIFNDSTDPQSDFTTTITPRLQARLRAGRTLFTGNLATGFVYYQKFDDQRTVDYQADGRFDADLDWFKPYATASLVDTRERLNAEIDVRAPRTQTALAAGARFVFSQRTAAVVNVRHSQLAFEQGTTFDGVPLDETLNSDTNTFEGGLEFYLTPLTTLTVTAARQEDRFESSPERDADSFRLLPTLKMEAPAIVQGSLAVGYRQFKPLNPDLPDYTGLIVQGSLTHTIGERTKLDFTATRDVQYSFEITEPYYVTTGFRLTVTQQITDPLDVRATAGRDRLDYRQDLGVGPVPVGAASGDSRTDRADLVGAGVGYRLRPNLRVGFDVEYARRLSDLADRRYDRTRVYGSLSYGF
jgi:hypothetical protein